MTTNGGEPFSCQRRAEFIVRKCKNSSTFVTVRIYLKNEKVSVCMFFNACTTTFVCQLRAKIEKTHNGNKQEDDVLNMSHVKSMYQPVKSKNKLKKRKISTG